MIAGRLHPRLRDNPISIAERLRGVAGSSRSVDHYRVTGVPVTEVAGTGDVETVHWPVVAAPDDTTAVSLIDRLIHHAVVLVTAGESFRIREAPTRRGGAPLKVDRAPPGGDFHLAN